MSLTQIVVLGVGGRMGQQLANASLDDLRHELVGATLRSNHEKIGIDVGSLLQRAPIGLATTGSLKETLASVDSNAVVIDFTLPHLTSAHAAAAAAAGCALLVGTTGITAEGEQALQLAAKKVPVLLAANTSLGANLLSQAVSMVTQAFITADVEVDSEIVEVHHRMKRDAPSGTALMLGQSIADTRGGSLSDWGVTSRSQDELRKKNDIGIFGIRGGTVAGEHTAYFFLDDERIELTHRVQDRKVFATGALTAARFLRGKPAGQYSMKNVLGFSK